MYKQINAKLGSDAARIEFWLAMGGILLTLIISVFDVISYDQAINLQNKAQGLLPLTSQLPPLLFSNFITVVSYLLLCFYVGPAFESGKRSGSAGILFVFIFIAATYFIGIASIYFTTLLAIKILFIVFNTDKRNDEASLNREAALLTATWILVTISMLFVAAPGYFQLYILIDVPVAITLYLFALYRLLPRAELKGKGWWYYFWTIFLLALLSCAIVVLVCSCFDDGSRRVPSPHGVSILIVTVSNASDDKAFYILTMLILLTQLFITAPLAKKVYKERKLKKDDQINTLKTELGKSDASLTFLKSQINPHFLFNALNTLFGTALQENAERTGEGIQKLGDMMRFMLYENTQDKIALSRDIDYLKNYILLQQLRTSSSPDILIESQIEDYAGDLMITPMLLIPFVENAFKHGISLVNPSHIKVSLQISGNTLYFDVHNSINTKKENDPEEGQTGIGMENVKQRLALLYPGRHELITRQSATEFFIHLTMQLDING